MGMKHDPKPWMLFLLHVMDESFNVAGEDTNQTTVILKTFADVKRNKKRDCQRGGESESEPERMIRYGSKCGG